MDQEIRKAFEDESVEVIQNQFNSWRLRLKLWLTEATQVVIWQDNLEREQLQYRSKFKQALTSSAQTAINDFLQQYYQNEKIQVRRKFNADYVKALAIQGYGLLNEIGEIIRGEEILYSITFLTLGSDHQAKAGITWKVPYSAFIQMVNVTKEGNITLTTSRSRINEVVSKMTVAQLEWNSTEINNFNLFNSQVRGASNQKWKKINNGNALEAYLRFINQGYSVEITRSKAYWRLVVQAIKTTMQAPDIFYKGGDIENLQVKGYGASVTNLSTLIAHCRQALNILDSAPNLQQLKRQINQGVEMAEIKEEQIIDEIIEDKLNQLTEMFTSSIQRN